MAQLNSTSGRKGRGKVGRLELVIALAFFGICTAISFALDTHTGNFGWCDVAFLTGIFVPLFYLAIVLFRPQPGYGNK